MCFLYLVMAMYECILVAQNASDVINSAIKHTCLYMCHCVKVKDGHFEHKLPWLCATNIYSKTFLQLLYITLIVTLHVIALALFGNHTESLIYWCNKH